MGPQAWHSVWEPGPAYSEAQLETGWLGLAQSVDSLIDSLGRTVQVIYPGRRSPGPGPDIEDAILSFDGGPAVRGDVEVHLDALDWYRHGHDADRAYESVVLQVVWKAPDSPYRGPPLVVLGDHVSGLKPLGARLAATPGWPCTTSFAAARPQKVAAFLEWQGWQRLVEKSEVFESNISVVSTDDLFYRGVMDALGYSQNRIAFRRLTDLLNWQILSGLLRGASADPLMAEAILFGSAGLLPSQRASAHLPIAADPRAARLEDLWTRLGMHALPSGIWRFHGVRPLNWPTRRLAAAAHLFGVALKPSPVENVLLTIVDAAETRNPHRLQRLLSVSIDSSSYWARRFDFGGREAKAPASLIGVSRAKDIVLNVAMPLALCVARSRGDAVIMRMLRELFADLGSVAENRFTAYMASLTGVRSLPGVRSAALQQGLMRLHQHWCRSKICWTCPAAMAGRAATDQSGFDFGGRKPTSPSTVSIRAE